MIITIDGPAGSGKSTVASRLAEVLGFQYLRTGLMYRAVALAGLRRGVDWNDPDALVRVAKEIRLTFDGPHIFLDGEDVSTEVETLRVTAVTKYSAGNPAIREILTAMQQEYAARTNCITEGRDQGTVVFPNAELKIFVTASAEVRAQRRYDELVQKGMPADYADILRNVEERDYIDSHREVSPLRRAADALLLDNSDLSIEEQNAWLMARFEEALG